jgi:hypothetical protein
MEWGTMMVMRMEDRGWERVCGHGHRTQMNGGWWAVAAADHGRREGEGRRGVGMEDDTRSRTTDGRMRDSQGHQHGWGRDAMIMIHEQGFGYLGGGV